MSIEASASSHETWQQFDLLSGDSIIISELPPSTEECSRKLAVLELGSVAVSLYRSSRGLVVVGPGDLETPVISQDSEGWSINNLTIGRYPGLGLTLTHPTVSRRHAVVGESLSENGQPVVRVQDLGSKYGTRVFVPTDLGNRH